MNMKKELSGVYAPITTPFDAQQNVDYAGLKKNMEKIREKRYPRLFWPSAPTAKTNP
jgi:dihydrodipicolinate synthase/N-acetylneuraminate lyase